MYRALIAAYFVLISACWASAAGKADWQGYDWKSYDFGACVAEVDGEGMCPVHHAKWDWKRNQWVDVSYGVDMSDRLKLAINLTNKDSYDDDDVCVTVLALDAEGANVFAHHQNRHSIHGEIDTNVVALAGPAGAWKTVTTLLVGSKQCRKGPHQDDAVFARVKAELAR